ncbi:flagellin [Thalassolituus pacificus]|uniref:Flagellin n=1 Tax=Thalassolituus pacificus TaxID=2975440 RepID=A0A9X3AJZ8_9GAMM|nr:flagellin [Thalassolituus pacificus]MCT7360856.1 flagellin [Thalassolituus pacificus]
MAISINNGAAITGPALNSQKNSSQQTQLAQQLSSGKRINGAADDAAGLAIATGLNSQTRGEQVAMRNAGDGISYTQVASGALSQVSDNLQRMRELAVQAGNGALADSDRAALQKEVTALGDSNQQILKDTSFNGQTLFSSDKTLTFQVGADAGEQIDVTAANLLQQLDEQGAYGLDVSTQQGAAAALSVVDESLSTVSSRQSELGAVANRFTAGIERSKVSAENSAAAQSRISDTDFAQATSERAAAQIREQAQIAVQAQANGEAKNILRLLGG